MFGNTTYHQKKRRTSVKRARKPAILRKIEADKRAYLISRRVYGDDCAELIAFFRSRAPKSEMSIRVDGPGIDDTIAMMRLEERAQSMASAADRSGKFSDVAIADIIDTAMEYLAKSESEM